MNIVYFTHSLRSCWNHGNAHFVRGVLSELARRGHRVRAPERTGNWSSDNLRRDHGEAALNAMRAAYPELVPELYDGDADLEALVDGADLVVVHEWNERALVRKLGELRRAGGTFMLLFHDTHHRAISAPHEIDQFEFDGYDGVLAFGEALSEVYRKRGWGRHVWTWHEAADTRRFKPPEGAEDAQDREGLIWIGNWGDGERTQELERFLFAPARQAGLPLDVYGVRYPAEARALLNRYGAGYRGWTANADVPARFAAHLATVHVPRRFYTQSLPGIPTIRMFEALACGIPLVSAPWSDSENLFRQGTDYLQAKDGETMTAHLKALKNEPELRRSLSACGLETVRRRHSCAHRADELLAIHRSLAQKERSAA